VAGSVNKVLLVGHVGKDPEIRSTQGGSKIANITLATSETWSDKASGERKSRTEWHKISVFNDNIVGVVERFVKKGSHLYIEGQLTTREWTDQQGNKRYSTEVNIGRFNGQLVLLDSKGGGERAPAAAESGITWGPSKTPDAPRPAPDLGDEIPF
jgi:single-strand DNA-binding protein